jgi:choline dehydrogenase-like flavoprotein
VHSRRYFDVCIVGAGAAGIAVANELNGSNLSVALLEAGGLEYSGASQQFYAGEEDTRRMPKNYLLTKRLRMFGGTTGHWTGEGRPLDEHDFEDREWIPHSGWPIKRRELAPFYGRAARYCGMSAIEAVGQGDEPAPKVGLGNMFSIKPLYYAKPVPRFGKKYYEGLEASKNIFVFLSAPVVEIKSNGDKAAVESVSVIFEGGKKFAFKARYFVISAGTVESARLLLNSVRTDSLRLGDERGAVGRYFMDHSEGLIGALRSTDADSPAIKALSVKRDMGNDSPRAPTLCVSPETQKREKLQNIAFEVDRVLAGPSSPDFSKSPFKRNALKMEEVSRLNGFLQNGVNKTGVFFRLIFRSETRPVPENCVRLTDSLDGLGIPRVKIIYRWNDEDLNSIERALELIAMDFFGPHGALVRRLHGAAQSVSSSFHQMGTTRMGRVQKMSVVDNDCRIHSQHNLFVAGSSVFPTAGWANPTLTLVALAIRLADHLKRKAVTA